MTDALRAQLAAAFRTIPPGTVASLLASAQLGAAAFRDALPGWLVA